MNRYREDLEAAVLKSRDSRALLARLVLQPDELVSVTLDAKAESRRFREWFESKIKKYGEILPYPEIPHKRVVQRDLQRRKPFNRDGAGYRDFLIWESTRKLALWGTERIVLVTNNRKDFGEGPLVDVDLQTDILNPSHVKLFSGLRQLNDALVVPKLKMLDDVKEALESGESGVDLLAWLRTNLVELLRDVDDVGQMIIGFPDRVGSVRPTQVVELHRLEIPEVRALESGEKLARVRVNVDIEFSVDIDWEDLDYQEVRDWIGPATEKFASSWSYQVERIEIELEVTLEKEKVTSHELLEISGPFGTIDLR